MLKLDNSYRDGWVIKITKRIQITLYFFNFVPISLIHVSVIQGERGNVLAIFSVMIEIKEVLFELLLETILSVTHPIKRCCWTVN